MGKGLLKAGLITGTALLGVAAGTYGVISVLMDIAVDRNEPRIMKPLSHIIHSLDGKSDYATALDEASKALESRPNEVVEMVNSEGMKLKGHFFRPYAEMKRLIITMHGWRSSWHWDYGLTTEFLLQNGCGILHTEQRGQRNSEGDYISFGVLERYDCREWIDWAIENITSELPIYLFGISMGATTVLMTTGFALPDGVKGVIADCGFTSPDEIWKSVSKRNLKIPYIISPVTDRIFKKKVHVSSKAYSTIRALEERNHLPVLFIHGEEDSFVPVEMTYANYDACTTEKDILIVPGGEHGEAYFLAPEEYEEHVMRFFGKIEGE